MSTLSRSLLFPFSRTEYAAGKKSSSSADNNAGYIHVNLHFGLRVEGRVNEPLILGTKVVDSFAN